MSSPGLPHILTPASAILARDDSPSRSRSPVRRIQCSDFEVVPLTHPTNAVLNRESTTSYCPDVSSPLQNFAPGQQELGTNHKYRQSITNAFLDKCKLPLISRATNSPTSGLHTPPPSEPASPTKAFSSFITSNTNYTAEVSTSTASKASTRARHTSRSLFDGFFTGVSAPINLGIVPTSPPSPRCDSPDELDLSADCYEMEGPFTRAPRSALTTRPQRGSTAQTQSPTTYGARLGGWFSGSRVSSTPSKPSPVGIAPEDPLINLNIHSALFPHGPADPLDPTSFNDLLSSAEALISRFQDSYKARCAEIREIRAESSVQKEEVEETETRAQHLKIQLDGMAAQLAAQERKADMLERMLEEDRSRRRQSEEVAQRRRTSIRLVRDPEEASSWKRPNTGSDSGFESDGESDFSASSPTIGSDTTAGDEMGGEKQAEKVRMVRISRDIVPAPAFLDRSTFGNADLRMENQRLHARIAELEDAVEGCLNMVSGPWGR